eukprot:jgi/Galph1/4164/GphlegSOOS_G2859.1
MSWLQVSRFVAPLRNRFMLKVTGKDAVKFLQGLVTQNVETLVQRQTSLNNLGYTAFLNKRGRLINEGFLLSLGSEGDNWLLDVHPSTGPELLKHLTVFRLRSKVDLQNVTNLFQVWAAPGFQNTEQLQADFETESTIFGSVDPRLSRLGLRLYLSSDSKYRGNEEQDERVYHLLKMVNGIPEGSVDYTFLQSLPFEANLDYLNGISFHKGCYLGQETTARVNYTGVVRKRLAPVVFAMEKDKATNLAEIIHSFYQQSLSVTDKLFPSQGLVESSLSTVPVNSALFVNGAEMTTKPVGQITSSVYNIGLARLELSSAFFDNQSGE